jgi:UDPglucose 6-dehydrogenase
MKVVCIGAGYVGCVTAAACAAWGYPTTVIDVDSARIAALKAGRSPIYEPGLEGLVAGTAGGLLQASESYEAVSEADVVFICVGTPSGEDGTADLSCVDSAAGRIAGHLNPNRFTVVVNKSTVPAGTADRVRSRLAKASGLEPERHFTVVSNPEFLREGFALEDVFFPDRIVIGAENGQARSRMRELYRPLLERSGYSGLSGLLPLGRLMNKPGAVYMETDTKSAELIKYASNAFLAVKISFINEIARLCDALGAHVPDVARGMGLDGRIGPKFLQVSSGWSGSCFPKDTAEILAASEKYGQPLTIVRAAVESNRRMHDYCVEKLLRRCRTLNGKTIAVLGLTFKPDTDDARLTQASYMIGRLLKLGASVQVHDPKGMEMFRKLNGSLTVQYCGHAEEAAAGADALMLLTHWKEYLELDWGRLLLAMRTPYVLDTRNVLADVLRGLPCQYEGLGLNRTGAADEMEEGHESQANR